MIQKVEEIGMDLDQNELDISFAEAKREFANRSAGVDAAINSQQQALLNRESLLMQRLQVDLLVRIYRELVAARSQ